MLNRVTLYVLVITLTAIAAVMTVVAVGPVSAPGTINAVLLLAAIGLVTHQLFFELSGDANGSIAFIPWLASALIAPNWVAVLGVTAANLLTQIVGRKSPLKAIFNIAQASLALSVAILAYLSLGGRSLAELNHQSLLESTRLTGIPFLVLISAFFAVNWLAVTGAIATSQRRSPVEVWKDNTLTTLVYDIISTPVVYFLAWFYIKFGPMGAAGFVVPLLVVRQLYKTLLQLEKVNQELLQLMVKAIEARDPYTSGHSLRVSRYATIIARAIKLSAHEVDRVRTAALLHDVGKIHEIYAPILRKPGKLTPEEWAIMQTHPIRSAELVATVSHLRDLVSAVRHHHENWDGSGYPDGLAGFEIPLESRIIMFADTIDAMTTDRPYRRALGESEVRAELAKYRGKQFDPTICDQLLASALFAEFFAPRASEFTPHRTEAVAA